MKPTDSTEFHMPTFDDEAPELRCTCTRVVVERETPETEQIRRYDGAFESRIEMVASIARGMEVVHAVEKVRRLAGDEATISVFITAPDRDTYDAINFIGQTDEDDGDSPVKRFRMDDWTIELGYRMKRDSPARDISPLD